jgi:hypothetical protein
MNEKPCIYRKHCALDKKFFIGCVMISHKSQKGREQEVERTDDIRGSVIEHGCKKSPEEKEKYTNLIDAYRNL